MCSSGLNKQTYKVKFSINERIEPRKLSKIDEDNDDDHQNEKNILMNTIIKTKSISPTIVEDEYFKYFIKELNPQFEMPTKEEFEQNIHTKYSEKQENLKNLVKSIDFACVKTSFWTDKIEKIVYLGLTCHFYKKDQKKYNLGVYPFDINELKPNSLANFIKKIVDNYDLYEKLVYLSIDDSILMKETCQILAKKDFSFDFNHIIHLILNRFFNYKVIDSIKNENNSENEKYNDILNFLPDTYYCSLPYSDLELETLKSVNAIIKKVEILVKLFIDSNELNDQLIAKQEKNPITFKIIKVIKKIKTYWCYLFTMFDRYIKLEKFVQQILSDSNEYKHYEEYFLIDTEIQILLSINLLLTPFIKTLEKKIITLDYSLAGCLYIRKKLNKLDFDSNNNEISKKIKSIMLDSFNFYIEQYEILNNPLLISAMFLSPRYFSFSNCTQNEKENFLKVAKQYSFDVWKKNFKRNLIKNENDYLNDLENEIYSFRKEVGPSKFHEFWRKGRLIYPMLFDVAKLILSIPSTNFINGRLFSDINIHIYENKNLPVNLFEKIMLMI